MAYNKHEWKARTGVGLNKFKDADGRVYEFTPAPDEVTQPGTPFSAEWMNEMEAGIAAAGIIYAVCDTAADTAAKVVNTSGAPEQLANGDNFRILFVNEVQAGATLNVNGLGAYPIIDNYTGEAIVLGDIGAGYVSDIIFENEQYMLLNAYRAAAAPSGHQLFTESGTFTVPARVTSIRVSACAAGVGQYAGAGIENVIYYVTPGQKIELTIGTGNTKIGDFETLIAGTLASSKPSTNMLQDIPAAAGKQTVVTVAITVTAAAVAAVHPVRLDLAAAAALGTERQAGARTHSPAAVKGGEAPAAPEVHLPRDQAGVQPAETPRSVHCYMVEDPRAVEDLKAEAVRFMAQAVEAEHIIQPLSNTAAVAVQAATAAVEAAVTEATQTAHRLMAWY